MRISHGRTPTLLTAALALLLLGAACDGDGDGGDGAATASPPAIVDSPTPAAAEAFAIWPETTRPAAEAAADDPEPYRADREDTALQFARKLLRWGEPEVEEYTGGIECGEGGCVVVRNPRTGAGAVLTMAQLVGGIWSVRAVTADDEDETPLGLSVEGQEVTAVFELGGAASAEFRIGYGARTAAHTYTATDDTPFTLGFDPEPAGYFLILFKDADGNVIRAQGSPLPAGDFTAG